MVEPLENLNQQIVTCARCPRLREWCQNVAREKKREFMNDDYWGRPVPNLLPVQTQPGDRGLLIIGLAPAAHGANRTGRMFTGDRSGEWLYRALHKAGFANQATSRHLDDGLTLSRCAITAVCHCAPPDNKPDKLEIANCQEYLTQTIEFFKPQVFLALGQIAWNGLMDYAKAHQMLSHKPVKFAHGASITFNDGRHGLASYHPSQQNTFTGRLTESMFDSIFQETNRLLAIAD
ncbi:Uracil DNA glycosylase superfamily protein [Planctopirus ephydatiae]|uniref:Type-5 uracil-DNA glycosylase n=1 Tax=Planctopirus ephydatiae TaxID=2528019 RepID=A0A518GNK3_9PLAN|nr:uracil-DNA glycosylase [Planctopirus ephydatiae]QDV30156.1 Uracil DNA glycosylase superfamily protein [Planctopirus ephydatiae]